MEITTKSKMSARRRRRRGVATNDQRSTINDFLGRAVEREREHRRVKVPERETVLDHVFECVCCGKMRGDEERREPRSEVCVRCVAEAGFRN